MADLKEQKCQDSSLKTHLPSCPLLRIMRGAIKLDKEGKGSVHLGRNKKRQQKWDQNRSQVK